MEGAQVRERINALAYRSFAVELSLDCERLNTLDDLWTIYLADPENEFELQENLPALQALVGEIVKLLTSISNKTPELESLVREFPSSLDAELDLLLAEHPARDWYREARPAEPLDRLVLDACAAARAEAPQAIVEIAEKLKKIADGEFQPGDIPRSLKCAVVVVGVGAGVLAACAIPGSLIVLPPAVAAGSSLVGAVASGLTAIWGWGCTQPAPKLA